jgi:hypothetical protein
MLVCMLCHDSRGMADAAVRHFFLPGDDRYGWPSHGHLACIEKARIAAEPDSRLAPSLAACCRPGGTCGR